MKLLILGVDAACWSIADPLMDCGYMPTLASLIADGWRQPLESTGPPISPPAWTTLTTGMKPARHGVVSFCRPDLESGLVKPTHGGERLVRTMFDYLGEAEATCGAVNIPWTYPAEALSGFAVSGFDAPALDDAAFFPREAADVVRSAAPHYSLHAYSAGPVGPAIAQIQQKVAATLALARWRPVDVLFTVLTETDTVAHVHWPQSPDGATQTDALATVYRAADEGLGRLMDGLNPDAVVVLSDHGMGPCGALVNLSRPLFAAGLMMPGGDRLARAVSPLYRTARWCYRLARRPGRSPQGGRGAPARVSRWAPRVDWTASRAHAGVGFGWVSLGPQATTQDQATVREAVMAESAAHDPPPVLGIQHVAGAPGVPELLFDLDYDAGYSACPPILDPREPFLIRNPKHPAFQRGSHRREGVFAAAGKGVARGAGEEPIPAHDVAPTLVYLADGVVPEDLDGQVHTEAIDEGHLNAHPPTIRPMSTQRDTTTTPYAPEQQRAVERRLRDLGYLG